MRLNFIRILFTLISFLVSHICNSQITDENAVVDSGKYEFKQQAQKQTSDYTVAYRLLLNQVSLNPKNAEFRYFLGYTIDRLNADDGKQMFQLKRDMSIKASEQFEEVNRLQPIYEGEIFILDPYSKISSIWGSLAEAYLSRKQIDSAKWAFTEGKRRGGFIEPILEFNRQLLNSCEENAILVTNGDNITIPIWYLQTIENFRSDITVVDANLINTTWYTKYLKYQRNLKIKFSDLEIDSIDYAKWQPRQITLTNKNDTSQKLTWILNPTYLHNYILKGDRILLNVFEENFFNRPIYFSANSDSSYNLFLGEHFSDEGLVSKVSIKPFNYKEDVVKVSKNLSSYTIEKIKHDDIIKSKDAIIVLNGFRWTYYSNIYRLVSQGDYSRARILINEMREKFSTDKLPFETAELEKNFEVFFNQINKNYR